SGESSEAVLNRAILQMRQASDKLAGSDSSLETQRLEKTVMELMDKVIAQAEKNQGSSSTSSSDKPGGKEGKEDTGSGKNTKPGQPGGQPSPGQGNAAGINPGGTRPPVQQPGPLNQNAWGWGNLPERLREELLQGQSERFSPLYEDLTQSYYKRL